LRQHGFLVAVGNDKKKRKERKGKVSHNVTKGLYFNYMGSRPSWTDFYENWQVEGAHDVIILSNSDFNFLGVSDLQGVKPVNISIVPLTLLVIVTTVLPLPRSL